MEKKKKNPGSVEKLLAEVRADFGLFYQLPMDSGPLYPVTNVLDTYISGH